VCSRIRSATALHLFTRVRGRALPNRTLSDRMAAKPQTQGNLSFVPCSQKTVCGKQNYLEIRGRRNGASGNRGWPV